MRILLVYPAQDRTRGLQRSAQVEPLGLEMIAGALQSRHEVALVDLRLESRGLDSLVQDFKPHLVGISSSFTVDIYRAINAAKTVKNVDPDAFVIVGGHHPSLQPADFNHAAIDAIAVGEGEITLQELAECLEMGGDIRRIPGLIINHPEGQFLTPQRRMIEDLDMLPLPVRSLTEPYRRHYYLLKNYPTASVETTRGCPYRCRFCSVWNFYQKKVRSKSPSRVIEDLATVKEPHVFFTDDNFLSDVRRSREIAGLIREKGIRKKYTLQARSDAIVRNPDLIAIWKEVGLYSVFIGFEKPTQDDLDALEKQNTVENNERALQILRNEGIEPIASFIVDTDYDLKDFKTLRSYVRRLKLKSPFFTVLTPLPGTILYEEDKEKLITSDYELFDVLHAVVPTRLPLDRFYRELAHLWRRSYSRWKLSLARLYLLWHYHGLNKSPTRYLREVLAEARHLGNARYYMQPQIHASVNRGNR